jgi:putative hydroxymethylpyrimidine transporter CytX
MDKSAGKGISVFGCGLVWFGAAVSIAEIEAGTALAPAAAGGRLPAVLAAILLGHLLGGALLFLAALLGARTRRSAMDCAKAVFAPLGGGFFAALNILQLVGWTAVMVAQGAGAAGELLGSSVPFPALCAAIGLLVAVWIYIGLRGVGRVNTVAMTLLFLLTALLFVVLLRPSSSAPGAAVAPMDGPVFWFAFEMSVAMPLSWLPLAADYTRDARRPLAASLAAAAVYSLVSCWMYLIGLLAADCGTFSAAFAAVGPAALSFAALLVVVLSTVTTTFLDAYSAGESARSLCSRVAPKPFGVAVVALGTLLAVLGLMDRYLDFLYLIASVFAPMAAALLVAGFSSRRPSPVRSFLAWLAGFALYHLCLGPDSLLLSPLHPTWTSPVGATLPALALSALLAVPLPSSPGTPPPQA